MKEAYKNMRNFWLDAKNFEGAKGLVPFGQEEIYAAGAEFCMPDNNNILKNIIIAANALGDASMYFENNSPSGIGGFLGQGHPKIKAASLDVLREADKMIYAMQPVKELPFSIHCKVTLFAVSKKTIFYAQFEEEQLRNPQNIFYPFFATTQLLISAFKAQEAASLKNKQG